MKKLSVMLFGLLMLTSCDLFDVSQNYSPTCKDAHTRKVFMQDRLRDKTLAHEAQCGNLPDKEACAVLPTYRQLELALQEFSTANQLWRQCQTMITVKN
jgi:hypothetical protein